MKALFFKTVRSTGRSVFAIGKFARNYEVGKSYKFTAEQPSHVFILNEDGAYYPPSIGDEKYVPQVFNSQNVYEERAERNNGNRVLVCYGELKLRKVPVCSISSDWRFTQEHNSVTMKWRWTSTNFTVVGEIKPKVVEVEKPFNFQGLQVIGKFNKKFVPWY